MNIKSAKTRSEAVLIPFSAREIGQSFVASSGRAEVMGDGRQR